MQKKKNHTDLTPFTKINSKWILDLNVKCKTMKLPEDDTGENLDALGNGNGFLDTTPKARFMKEIIGNLHYKLKALLCKRQCQEN